MKPIVRAALALISCAAAWRCGFPPLERVAEGADGFDELENSVLVNGIQVSPPVIHSGERVTLRDPFVPGRGALAPLYLWDACAGAVSQAVPYSRQATWVAPPEPGQYDLTLNISNAQHTQASRTIRLCVVRQGEQTCSLSPSTLPQLSSVEAEPSELICPEGCETTLRGLADVPRTTTMPKYRWAAVRGQLSPDGATAKWQLPGGHCCPETFTAALTVCVENAAATGIVNVSTTPD